MQPIDFPPVPETNVERPGCAHYLLFAIAAAWTMAVVALVQGGTWFNDQYAQTQGESTSSVFWLLAALGQAVLLALPIVPLAWFTRAKPLRAAYLTWALAIGLGLLFSLARLLPATWTQSAALVQIAFSLVAVVALSRLRSEPTDRGPRPLFSMLDAHFAFALAVGLLVALPWLHYGALGSPLDSVLNVLAGFGLGLVAARLLSRWLVAPLLATPGKGAGKIAFGGIAIGIALLILGAGFGFGGSQLLLLLVLPALGFAAMALAALATNKAGDAAASRAPIAALVGIVAAAPLMFVDPDELTLLLGLDSNEILGQAFRAARFSILLAWALGLLLWALAARGGIAIRRGLALGGLAGAGVAAVLIYSLAGQPGFYGERLFVILRDQADVSAAVQIADRTERLRSVYSTLTQHATSTQANLRATLDSVGVSYRPYYLVNAIEVDGGPALRAYLAMQPEVDRIIDSPHLRPLPATTDGESESPESAPSAGTGAQWNIQMIRADDVWSEFGATGQGIVVGQSDSGVQGDHPALREGYRGRDGQDDYNWLDPWNASRSPTDVGGHGTHTTGSAVGRNGIGVAPGAEWIGCVNLARGLGNSPAYLECMQFMLAPYAQGGDAFTGGDPARAAHVLNNSWGCPPIEGCDAGSLGPAVRALRAAGIFVVASAGNTGPNCSSVSDPIAIYDDAFSVGAIDERGSIAPFSSRGPVDVDGSGRVKPDIVAPGVEIRSAWPGSTYNTIEGTSMAGPHVVGVVALMWSANPRLIGNIDETERILIETAQPYTGLHDGCFEGDYPNNAVGYGIVDAYAAVQAALDVR